MVFRYRIPDEQPTALLDEVCDERFSVKRADVTPLPRGPSVVVGHGEPIFPLLRTVGPQMPEQFAVCGATFKPPKANRVGAPLHLGARREFVGRLPRTGRISFCGAGPPAVGVAVLHERLEVEVSGVLVASKHERQDDAGTTHEHEGESCGTGRKRTSGF